MTKDSQKRGRDALRILPGILISILFIAGLLYLVDLSQVKTAWQQADYRFAPAAGLVLAISIVARAVAWRAILGNKVSFGKTFLTINEGYLLNTFLPFRLGEVGRTLLMSSTTGLSFWEVLATVLVERIFDIAIMSGLLLATIPFVIGAEWALQAASVSGALVLVGFAVLYGVARNPDRTLNLFARVFARLPKVAAFGRDKLTAILSGLSALTDLRRFLTVFFWMLACWALNVLWYFILLCGFLPDPHFLWAAFTVGMTGLGVAVPSSPGFIGVLEGSIVFGLTSFGVAEGVALAYAVVSHAVYFVVTVTFGLIGLARDGESLSTLYLRIRQRKDENQTASEQALRDRDF